jgi:hypothetical protein
MSKASRRLAGLLAVAAIVLSAVVAGPALAAPAKWDPQTANVPYLAWRGEQVRLVKCDPVLATEGVKVEFFVEEWSGSGLVPRVEDATVDASAGCAKADVVSLDPGLARVKLVATDASGDPILKHQFLVIWMSLTDPAIDEVGSADPTGDRSLGDPAGDGNFNAGGNNGRVQVEVKGTFPYGGTTYTLPDAWTTLAGLLAQDADSNPFNNADKWDIHDDRLKTEGHPVYSQCTTQLASVSIDAVDNCNGANGDPGPFSRVFGDLAPALGPFDPVRPEVSLFTDGKLDSGDAPMPAARVDVSIAPNSGAPTDISGVGSLESADKTNVYSRNGNGSFVAHNLYAPFYAAWIPATSRPGLASGIDGPASGNNFTGFLVDGIYDYWSIADTLRTAVPSATTCLRRSDGEPAYRQTPAGAQSVAVYTDEHGEAQVEYNPGTGAYYDALPAIHNANGGCDLEGIDILGTSSITATARYPYKAVDDTAKVSDPLHKEVHSLFTKNLVVYPKGAGEENDNSRIVVARAIDVDGTPFVHERVCFNVSYLADGVFPYFGTVAPGVTIGGSEAPGKGTADSCSYTDENGRAAVEVLSSGGGLVNVIADFDPEGLLRSTNADFGTVPPPTGTTPDTTPPTTKEIKSNPITVTKVTKGDTVVQSDRIFIKSAYLVKRGKKVSLVVRVKSDFAKHARLRAKVLGKHRRKLGTWTKSVRTNHKVTIRVNRKARAARLALVR